MATFLDGRIPAALELFTQVADLLTDSGDLLHVVTPASTAGHALVFAADPEAGLVRTTAALELARSLGHAEGVTYALWHRSEALAALGRADEAAGCAREALAVAGRLGHRGWTATALRALGIALRTGGDLPAAAEAFRRSLDTASGGLTLFSSWAAAQLALTLIAGGDPAAAGPLVHRALTEGPALAQYEARLAGPSWPARAGGRTRRRWPPTRRGWPGPAGTSPRCPGWRSWRRAEVGQLVVGEAGPQVLLGELADRGLRHLVDEHDVVGQPPLGHPRRRGSRAAPPWSRTRPA